MVFSRSLPLAVTAFSWVYWCSLGVVQGFVPASSLSSTVVDSKQDGMALNALGEFVAAAGSASLGMAGASKVKDILSEELWKDQYPSITTWKPQKQSKTVPSASSQPYFLVEPGATDNGWSPSRLATRKTFASQQDRQPKQLPANLSPQQAYFATRIAASRQRALLASLQTNRSSQQGAVQVLGRTTTTKMPITTTTDARGPSTTNPRQFFFAQRVRQARQQTLLTDIAHSKAARKVTMAKLGTTNGVATPRADSAHASLQQAYFAQRIALSRQRALLDGIAEANKAQQTTTTIARLSGNNNNNNDKEQATVTTVSLQTTTSKSFSASQQYFAQRIQQSRQRALLANIDAAKAAATTTTATLGGSSQKATFASADTHDRAAIVARQAYFSKRIAESRQRAQQRRGSTTTMDDSATATNSRTTMAPNDSTMVKAAAISNPVPPKKFSPIKPKATTRTVEDSAVLISKADQTIQQAKLDMEAALKDIELLKKAKSSPISMFSPTKKSSSRASGKPWALPKTKIDSNASPNKSNTANGIKPFSDSTTKPWTPSTKSQLSDGRKPFAPQKGAASLPFATKKDSASVATPWGPLSSKQMAEKLQPASNKSFAPSKSLKGDKPYSWPWQKSASKINASLGQAAKPSTFSRIVADKDGTREVAKPWTPNKTAAAEKASEFVRTPQPTKSETAACFETAGAKGRQRAVEAYDEAAALQESTTALKFSPTNRKGLPRSLWQRAVLQRISGQKGH